MGRGMEVRGAYGQAGTAHPAPREAQKVVWDYLEVTVSHGGLEAGRLHEAARISEMVPAAGWRRSQGARLKPAGGRCGLSPGQKRGRQVASGD